MNCNTDVMVDADRGRSFGVAVYASAIIPFLITALIYSSQPLDVDSFVYPGCVLLVVFYILSVWLWWRTTGRVFDLYILFFTAAFLFNCGHAVLEVFHLNRSGFLFSAFTSDTEVRTIFLVGLSLWALHLGALIGVLRSERSNRAARGLTPTSADVRLVGWVLLVVTVIPSAVYLMDCLRIVLTSGYWGLFREGGFTTGLASIPRVLSVFLAPGAMILLAGSKGMKANTIFSASVFLAFCFFGMFLGLRSAAALPLVAYIWLWDRVVRPVPKWSLLAVGLTLFCLVLPLTKVIRSAHGEDRSSISFITGALFSMDNPVVLILSEMGSSMMTTSHTLNLVPSVRGYDYGAGYLGACMTLVPGLYWSSQESYAQWLVWQVDPPMARAGGGYGYSFIAEAFINFGWVGGPMFLAIIGLSFASLLEWAERSNDLARLAFLGSAASFLLYWARNGAAGVFGRLFWCALVPYLCILWVTAIRQRSRQRQQARDREVVAWR